MAAPSFCAWIMLLTVLSAAQIISSFPNLPPPIATDPHDRRLYSPYFSYAGDLFKDNIFDYSSWFPAYEYKSGARNRDTQVKKYYENYQDDEHDRDYENAQAQNQGYHGENSKGEKDHGENSKNQRPGGSGAAPGRQIEIESYNDDQTGLMENIPIIGQFFSTQQKPFHSQQTSHGQQQKQSLHKPSSTSKININSNLHKPAVLLSNTKNPNIPTDFNSQSEFLQALASNPSFLDQLQSLVQAQQKQGGLQPSTGAHTDTQSGTAEAPNPSQTLTTPRPLKAPKAPTPDTPSVPKESAPLTPSGTELPTAIPIENESLASSLPAPSPVQAPPLAVPPGSPGNIHQ